MAAFNNAVQVDATRSRNEPSGVPDADRGAKTYLKEKSRRLRGRWRSSFHRTSPRRTIHNDEKGARRRCGPGSAPIQARQTTSSGSPVEAQRRAYSSNALSFGGLTTGRMSTVSLSFFFSCVNLARERLAKRSESPINTTFSPAIARYGKPTITIASYGRGPVACQA